MGSAGGASRVSAPRRRNFTKKEKRVSLLPVAAAAAVAAVAAAAVVAAVVAAAVVAAVAAAVADGA